MGPGADPARTLEQPRSLQVSLASWTGHELPFCEVRITGIYPAILRYNEWECGMILLLERIKQMEQEQSDSTLIRDFKNGCIDAYNELVKRYGPRLYAVIFRMTKDHKSTDDLMQESFIKLYYSIQTFKEEMPFYPWLYRIAVNQTINYLKKNKKCAKISIEGDEVQLDSELSRSSIPCEVSNPERALQTRELHEEINKAMQKLPPAMRAVFTLRIFDDRTYNEIAEILHCSLGTVMSRLNRAREKMKRLLGDYVNDSLCTDAAHPSTYTGEMR
jgi:RNA polymerase sigma-70 factor, ECF subfamily